MFKRIATACWKGVHSEADEGPSPFVSLLGGKFAAARSGYRTRHRAVGIKPGQMAYVRQNGEYVPCRRACIVGAGFLPRRADSVRLHCGLRRMDTRAKAESPDAIKLRR